ncbi:ligand-binding sensor domain-containing protein [Azospirillum sp. sgz301742]
MTTHRRFHRMLAAGAVLLSAMGSASAQTKTASPAAIESFNVGERAYVRSLAMDPGRNSLWVGTSVGVLEVDLKGNAPKNTFTREQGLANEYVFAIGVSPDPAANGKVWFGTNAGGTSTYDKDGKWKVYFPMHGLADYWVYAFAFDRQGGTWIGTWDGANYVDPKTGAFTTYRSELINIWVYGIDIDAEGKVWFGTEGGVTMHDGKTWTSWTHKDGLGAENAGNLPRSANTGLGTRSRHDLALEAAGQETYNPNYVFSVKVDSTGRGVWFGTWGGGVSLYDGKTWKSFSTADGLAGNVVYSIAQDAEGGLWFGTNHGVSHYDGKRFVTYTKADGLLNDNVYAIALTPDGSAWFGTLGGVSHLLHRKQ